MEQLQKLCKLQLVKLLDAINREGLENDRWTVYSNDLDWNAEQVFSMENSKEEFEWGDYIFVYYEDKYEISMVLEACKKYNIPQFNFHIEDDLFALIFKF